MIGKIALVVWGTLLVQLPAWGQCFQGPTNYATGRGPGSATVGDFNGDGKPDLVTANEFPDNVSVLPGNGDGTFQAALNTGTFVDPVALAVGDFNKDGKPDLAVANRLSGSVLALIGNGDGTFVFSSQNNYSTGDSPNSVAVADLNADTNADLVVVNSSALGSSVSVLLGNGNGTFQAATNTAVGGLPGMVVVGDFNGDGKPDLAVSGFDFSDNSYVLLFLGQGNGTFQSPSTLAVGKLPEGLAAADLNADGKLDLAVANSSGLSNSVSVLLGNGNGTFQPKVDYAAGAQPRSVAVGDLNGDGKLDLAVPNNNDNTVSVLLGNGDGTFQAKTNYAVGTEPQSAAVGDFDGNGKLDLAAANYDDATVSVLLNVAPTYTVGVSGAPVCAGQALTLAVSATCPGGTLTAELSNASGSFASPVGLGTVTPGSQSVTIPAGTAAGAGYRVRVVSAEPAVVGEASEAFTVNVPGVARPTVEGVPVCNGQAVTLAVSATCSGALTAQLSGPTGDFASPVSLGPVTPGSQSVTIPAGTAAGAGYRVRVVSANPAVVGEASDAFTVNTLSFAGAPTVAGAPLCAGQAVALTFGVGCVGNAQFEAQLSSKDGSFAVPVGLGPVAPGSSSVTIPAGTAAGTGYRIRVVSTGPVLASEASAPFTVNALGAVSVALYPATPARICLGENLPVTFATTGACPFPVQNVFTVQLSGSTGSFANPLTLGVAQPGTTSFALPQNLPAGTGYRVRVLSSNPAQVSASSLPFELRYPSLSGVTPGVGGVPSGGLCRGDHVTLSFGLPAGSCAFPEGNVFTAQLSSATGSFNNPVSLGSVQAGVPNFVTIPAGSVAGTGYRIRVVSSNPALTSNASIPFRVNACASRLSAEEAQLVVAPNPVSGREIRVRVSGMDHPAFSLTSGSGRAVGVTVNAETAEFVLVPRQALAPGLYVVWASEGALRLSQRVLVVE